MTKKPIQQVILFTLLSAMAFPSSAWDKSFEAGYGTSRKSGSNTEQTSGVLINSDFLSFYRTPDLYLTANASVGKWHADTSHESSLSTAALSLALRYYVDGLLGYPLYALGTGGPAYLNRKSFGNNDQGSNYAFQWSGGAGLEVGIFDINVRVLDFIRRPALSFNAVYMLSVGILY